MLTDQRSLGERQKNPARRKVQKAADWEDARWCNLPPAVVEDLRLSLTHFRLLAYIGRVGRAGGWCALSQKEAAARFGVTRQAVNRAVGDLIDWGYLQKRTQKQAKSATCEYRVFLDAEPLNQQPETSDFDGGTCNVEVTRVEPAVYTPCNVEVTPHNKEEAEEAIIANTPLPPRGRVKLGSCDALAAFNAYNELAPKLGLPQAVQLTPGRKRKIEARLRTYGMGGWQRALANVERSAFLLGQTPAGFCADLDFICQAKSFDRLHDGGYGTDAKPVRKKNPPAPAEDLDAIYARMRAEDGWRD